MTDVALRFKALEDGLEAQFKKVNSQLDSLKQNADKVGSAIGTTFKAIGAIAAIKAVGNVVNDLIGMADGFVKVNAQTGIAINKVQEYTFITGQADVAVEAFTGGVARMQRALVSAEEGQKSSAEALDNLGIKADEFFQLKPDEQFKRVAIAVSAIEDPAIKTDRVMDLLGRGGAELIPVLDAIGKNSAELTEKFAEIGGPIGEDSIRVLDDLGDQATATGVAFKSLGAEILAIIAPPIIVGLREVGKVVAGLRIAAGGGSNESVNIDNRIAGLEHALMLEKSLAVQNKDRVKKLQDEIDLLKERQEILLGLGKAGRAVRLEPLNFPLSNPLDGGGPLFEETDEARKEREDLEEMALRQRAENRANAMLEEQNAKIEHERVMAQIDQAALDQQVARYLEASKVKLNITSEFEDFQAQIREVFNLRAIKLEEIKNQSIFGLATGLFMDLARENTKFAKLQQGIALAQTIYSTAAGIMKAFQTLPWPASIIAAGKVALTGAIQVAKIKSTNYSGGGGSASSVSGGSASSASERAPPIAAPAAADTRGSTSVYITGFLGKDMVKEIVGAIRSEMDRDVVLIPTNSLQAQVLRSPA